MDLLDGDETVFESLEDSFPQANQGSISGGYTDHVARTGQEAPGLHPGG